MPNPPTASEVRFDAYLKTHGYIGEADTDWRRRFQVDTPKNPDRLVTRAGEELAICEVKEWRSSPVDSRMAQQRAGSFSSEEVYGTAADAVQAAAGEQLRPFKDAGLPLVVVLANPYHVFVPLGADDMTRSLFGTTDAIRLPRGGPAIPQRVIMGEGALVDFDDAGKPFNPHPYLSAVVVVHAREEARDFAEREFASRRLPDRSTLAERRAEVIAGLKAWNAAVRAGRVPEGEYQWVEVFDLSGLDDAFGGTSLQANIFDGPRDRWYVLGEHGFVHRGAW